jgi:hypothetical protein
MCADTTLPAAKEKQSATARPSAIVRIAGMAVRTLFLVILTIATARVASPQIENYWTVYETPGDLIRIALGFAVCFWCVVNVFRLPKDADGYRTWLYLGPAILPLALGCTIVVW